MTPTPVTPTPVTPTDAPIQPSGEPYVRPDVRAFLDMLAANPRFVINADTIAALRAMPFDPAQSMDVAAGALACVRDLVIPGPAGPIPARLFDARAERGPGPVVLFFHGGGYVLGSIDSHAAMAAEIARGVDLPVVSVGYRLAPEHPWPAAPDDAEAAARWLAGPDGAAACGRGFTGLVPCGDSAGGNLAIVTALALRDAPAALPLLLHIALYPAVDDARRYPSGEAFARGYLLEAADMAYYEAAYAPDHAHWRGAPILAEAAGLPPGLIVTAALDPLRDQGRAWAARLIAAGVSATYMEVAGQIHGFLGFRRMIPSAGEDFARILAAARAMLGAPPAA